MKRKPKDPLVLAIKAYYLGRNYKVTSAKQSGNQWKVRFGGATRGPLGMAYVTLNHSTVLNMKEPQPC